MGHGHQVDHEQADGEPAEEVEDGGSVEGEATVGAGEGDGVGGEEEGTGQDLRVGRGVGRGCEGGWERGR